MRRRRGSHSRHWPQKRLYNVVRGFHSASGEHGYLRDDVPADAVEDILDAPATALEDTADASDEALEATLEATLEALTGALLAALLAAELAPDGLPLAPPEQAAADGRVT